jgi:hypothetical protein
MDQDWTSEEESLSSEDFAAAPHISYAIDGWTSSDSTALMPDDFALPYGMWVSARSAELAAARNRYARRLLTARLPRRLHWLVDRPRTLRWIFRVRPEWRPSMAIITLRPDQASPPMLTTFDMACAWAEQWLAEAEAQGSVPQTTGLIFVYTTVDGLPSEVYGDQL